MSWNAALIGLCECHVCNNVPASKREDCGVLIACLPFTPVSILTSFDRLSLPFRTNSKYPLPLCCVQEKAYIASKKGN